MDHHKRVLVLLAIARFHAPVIFLDLEVKPFNQSVNASTVLTVAA
ncbi:MAG TPA: hypothetical protein VFS76_13030 [Pyrinomonadaceae bacterium]|nr:hypothetical protein [Pyrinomonadaceae bacterium]